MKKTDRFGYTLIEMIIVIAIMAVLLGFAGVAINTVFSNKAKAASKEIYNLIGSAQTLGMSKENVYFAMSRNDSGEYQVGIAQLKNGAISMAESRSIPNKVTIKIDGVELGAGKGVLIEINRSTGAFKKTYSYDGGVKGAGISNISIISVVSSNGEYSIQLSYTNGKFFYLD